MHIAYDLAKHKSELLRDLLPLLNSGKYHRYEFAHGDDADFIAYHRHRGDGVCRRFQLG